ncbi:VOC family protein [Thioclava sp. 15-R06ZXC-3]|uniref:VOC family protein n=1 Tax=Thioclava arctica TaxID=3238301 RepID=A0ABV3TPS8_9RHOB
MTIAKLRIARPTDDIEALKPFYIDGLCLKVLAKFSDHSGFDGLMVGDPELPYHFEFTKNSEHLAGRAPTKDNLIVFYLPDTREWKQAVQRMQDVGFAPVTSFNPYWDILGRTFEDPDGYRVVLQNASWG